MGAEFCFMTREIRTSKKRMEGTKNKVTPVKQMIK
jgi:hypothetical protein